MTDPDSIRAELAVSYERYCLTVSHPHHALSLETGTFLLWSCRTRQPKAVADFGSGWSSYVLRLYGKESGATVTSVDTDEAWLERTRLFLDQQAVSTDGLMLWDDYTQTDLTHDLILHDLANGKVREAAMTTAAERLTPDGILIFDDDHHAGHHAAATQVCDQFGLRLMDIKALTVDRIGRFAAVAAK